MLNIQGTGAIKDFFDGLTPWYEQRDIITSVTFSKELTKIGTNTFFNCSNITAVYIPETVSSIDPNAFNTNNMFSIYGYYDTAAEAYANANDISFKLCSNLNGVLCYK